MKYLQRFIMHTFSLNYCQGNNNKIYTPNCYLCSPRLDFGHTMWKCGPKCFGNYSNTRMHTHTHIDINAFVRHWWAFGSHCKLNNTHTPCGRLLFIELVAFELNARESEGVGMAIMQCPIQIWIVRRPRSQRVQIKF